MFLSERLIKFGKDRFSLVPDCGSGEDVPVGKKTLGGLLISVTGLYEP